MGFIVLFGISGLIFVVRFFSIERYECNLGMRFTLIVFIGIKNPGQPLLIPDVFLYRG